MTYEAVDTRSPGQTPSVTPALPSTPRRSQDERPDSGPGEVRGADEPVVPGADDDRVVVLIAAEDGGLRPFSGPDLAETHGLQRRRLGVRSDQFVFLNACVRAVRRNTAH